MGWFDVEPKEPSMSNIESYIKANFEDYVREHNINGLEELMQRVYIEGCFSEDDDDVLVEAALDLVRANISVMDNLEYIKDIYSRICVDKSSIEALEVFKQYVKVSITRIDFCNRYGCGIKILNAFDDTEVALEYLKFLTTNKGILKDTPDNRLSRLMQYLPQARKLYIRDRQFLSAAMDLVNGIEPSILKYGTEEEIDAYISKVVVEDKKANGIYDIDERRFAEVAPYAERLDSLLELCDERISILQSKLDEIKAGIAAGKIELCNEAAKQLKEIKSQLEVNKAKIARDYRNILEEERQTLVIDKKAILDELELEGKKQLQLITELANRIQVIFSAQEASIKSIGDTQEKRLQTFIDDNEKLSNAIAKLGANDEFVSKMSGEMEELRKTAELISEKTGIIKSQIIRQTNETISHGGLIISEDKTDMTSNGGVSFKQGYRKLVNVSFESIRKNGTIYHEKFEQIFTQIQLDEPIMLIGPAGSGKSVAIEQIAEILGMNMYYTNNASNEFKLTGFIDAGGNYRGTEFYKAFKYGGVFFLDEIDNSDPSALIVINSALANGYMAFPHETIYKHPNFRMVAAANTWGKGADLQYVGRNALDASTLDRFDNIFFDYDRNLEKALYPNNEVLTFMWAFRDAVLKTKIPHVVSTRGIGKVYKKEINGIRVEDTLTSNVVKNLSQDDVNTIIGNMRDINESNKYYNGIKRLKLR